MSNVKTIKSRILFKTDNSDSWDPNFIPEKGEMCIYFDHENGMAPRIKIGDGTSKLGNLHFTGNVAIPNETILSIVNSNNGSSKLGEFILGTSTLA